MTTEYAEFDRATHEPKVYHRSVRTGGRDDWATPPAFFQELDREFKFIWDVAATADNVVFGAGCQNYFGPDNRVPLHRDALAAEWGGGQLRWTYFGNVPYSLVARFVKHAAEQVAKYPEILVVLLLPARTDTRWFHDYLWDRAENKARPGVEVRFLKGRLTFVGAEHPAPFPSMVAVLRGKDRQ